ncbi:MAG: methyltransferase domain-containing protein [Devosia sp.]
MTQADIEAAAAVAAQHCREVCRDYHMTRPYFVASGVRMGPSRDSKIMRPLLQRFAPTGARVLIAGAADAGLASFVWESLSDRQPAITVIDQCETPLILTQRYAAGRAVEIATRPVDILRLEDMERYDLIVAHLVFSFIEPDHRPGALARLSRALAPGGSLVVAAPRSRASAEGRSSRNKLDEVLQGLEAHGFSLPAQSDHLLAAMQRELGASPAPAATLASLEPLFASAGLALDETVDAVSEGTEGRVRRRVYLVLRRA